MKKILILLAFTLQFTNLYPQLYYDPIDSTIASFHLTDQDWIISLTIDQTGTHYDALGNAEDNDPNGTFILKKINNNCYLQRLNKYYHGEQSFLKFGIPISIYDSIICSYTKDSIQKGENEWTYPYIYRNDSLGVYNLQQQSDHAPFYRMCLRTKQLMYFRNFPEIDVFTSARLFGLVQMNLNAEHNTNTFIYRVFMNLTYVVKKKSKILILQ